MFVEKAKMIRRDDIKQNGEKLQLRSTSLLSSAKCISTAHLFSLDPSLTEADQVQPSTFKDNNCKSPNVRIKLKFIREKIIATIRTSALCYLKNLQT